MSTELDSMTWEFNCPQYVDFSSNPPKTPSRIEGRAVGSTDSCDHWFTPSAKTPGHLISLPGRPELDGLEEGSPLVLETTFRVSSDSASGQAIDVPVIQPDVIPQSHSQETSSNAPEGTSSDAQRVKETPSKIPKLSAIPTSVKKTVSAAIRSSIPTSVTVTTPEKQSRGGRRSKTSAEKKTPEKKTPEKQSRGGRRSKTSPGKKIEKKVKVLSGPRPKMKGSLKKDAMMSCSKTPGHAWTPTSHQTPKGCSTLLQPTLASCQKKSCIKGSNSEEELVKEMRKMQFRATPVNKRILSSNSLVCGIPKVTRSKVTKVLEFKFQTDERIKIRTLRRSLVGALGYQNGSNVGTIGEKENHGHGMDGGCGTSSNSSLGTPHFMSQTVSSSLKTHGSIGAVGTVGNVSKVQPKVISRQAPKIMSRK